MSEKIQGQAGVSLADIYEVRGSIAGIERLESHELSLVHEVGATVFSERLGGEIERMEALAVAQSTAFDITVGVVTTPSRVFGVQVFADVTARIDHVAISIRDVPQLKEIPIWMWDSALDTERTLRIVDDGAAVADVLALVGVSIQVPSMMMGTDQRDTTARVVMRGVTSAFGAGDVTIVGLLYIGFPSGAGNLSSYGLPIPSW